MRVNDLTFAVRQLFKNPGFSSVAVLTLALGIGVNLTLFGILDELLLRPKPVAQPDELWAIAPANKLNQPVYANVCRPYYEAIRQGTPVFKGLIGYANIMPKLRTKEGVERITAELVSGEYFSFLGVTPQLGRTFLPEEDAGIGTHSVAVISHAFWKTEFAGSYDVLGKTVSLNDKSVEIIGVAPKHFTGLDFAQPALWMPTSMEKMLDVFASYRFVGRLAKPELATAAGDLLSPIVAEVTESLSGFSDPQWSRYGVSPEFQHVRLEAIGRGILGASSLKSRIVDSLQFGAVAAVLLLLIACANVANLFLARALQRRKEIATRFALGATRSMIVRQLVCEGVLVAACGTAGALLAYSWLSAAFVKLGGWWHGPHLSATIDLRILLFAVLCVFLVGIGFSVLPALHATCFHPFSALKDAEGGAEAGRKRTWLRHGLIVAQIVGSLVLLCGAMLCLRSMSQQFSVDVGYRTDRLAIAPLNLERIGFGTNTAVSQLAEITRRVGLVPGVEQVGICVAEPLAGWESTMGIPQLEGFDSPGGESVMIGFADIGPSTFAAMGVPILHGREITQTDVELGRNVALVNETFVRRFWPGQEVLGKRIHQSEVIGIVKDVRFGRFDKTPGPMMFRVGHQTSFLNPKLLIRSKDDSRRIVSAVRRELVRIHPKLIQGDICTLRDTLKRSLAIQNAALQILGALGVLALLLAAIGTYGVMAYLVANRTREIGIRLAVGATRNDVLTLILASGLRLSLIALAIGLPLSLSIAGYLRHRLAGISPFDPVSYILVASAVIGALMCACWMPARRAAKVEPVVALRSE